MKVCHVGSQQEIRQGANNPVFKGERESQEGVQVGRESQRFGIIRAF